mmetsp:Transcript_2331/g.3110  ORF Transcript_2331/g.3110 Transcript_2331/m.3110 type:complete len:195 (-) Transcript_2331:1188-1772(-)
MFVLIYLYISIVKGLNPIIQRRTWLLVIAPQACSAACLKGDDSVNCLGTYIEHADDITKKDAEAAGIQWIEPDRLPSSKNQAISLLKEQRKLLHQAALNSNSQINESGKALLRLRPRVKNATSFLLQTKKKIAEMQLFSNAVDRTLISIDEAEMAIGYVVRTPDPTIPDLIYVSDTLATAEAEFDTLLRFVLDD